MAKWNKKEIPPNFVHQFVAVSIKLSYGKFDTSWNLIVNHTSKYFQCRLWSFFRSNNKRRKWKKMQLPMKMTSLQKIPKNQKIELEKVVVANASIQIIPACWPFWYITQVITFYLSHIWCIHFTWDTFGLERYANVSIRTIWA